MHTTILIMVQLYVNNKIITVWQCYWQTADMHLDKQTKILKRNEKPVE